MTNFAPLVELTRGGIVESVHAGAFAVADASGHLHASAGDPDLVAFLRSTAKPFQALPLVERGGAEKFGLSPKELAVICASHSGTDEQVEVIRGIQARLGLSEADLQCGVHPPSDKATAERMLKEGEAPTALRHNCSGKHTGMLALAQLLGADKARYLEPDSPVQQMILGAFAEMCGLDTGEVVVGTDGCSAPNFAVPLQNAALGLARLAESAGEQGRAGAGESVERRPSPRLIIACGQIVAAMTAHPDMVGGPGRFDTRLMQAARGKLVAKGGAEGYQGAAILPGALGSGSPALGLAIKIADGDQGNRARALVTVEVLRQLGALDESQLAALEASGPGPLKNWRGLEVGEIRPCFAFNRARVD
jgi:L-asparaginase II